MSKSPQRKTTMRASHCMSKLKRSTKTSCKRLSACFSKYTPKLLQLYVKPRKDLRRVKFVLPRRNWTVNWLRNFTILPSRVMKWSTRILGKLPVGTSPGTWCIMMYSSSVVQCSMKVKLPRCRRVRVRPLWQPCRYI